MTVSRTLDRIRAAAPPAAPEPPIELEPATDADELALMREKFRADMRSSKLSPRDQQGAARLVLAIMEAQRGKKSADQPQDTQTAGPSPQPSAAASELRVLSPEEEAAAVAAQLGKRRASA